MKRLLGKLVIFLTGWKSQFPKEFMVNKSVMIAAPHTSNWDLLHALAVFWDKRIPVRFFIKDNYTKGLHGIFFKWIGAIGVDRSKKGNLVDYAVTILKEKKHISLLVPAEGSRKKVDKWKTGFYHIAKQAEVPVLLGYLDYKNKIAGVGDLINLTGNFEADMQHIQDFYKTITAKYPEQYNERIF